MSSVQRNREPFRLPLRVYYEDTDAGGIVYYANYLKYMERARTEWLASLGCELSALERVEGIVFVVHRVEIDYRIPAKLGERIDATVTLVELHRARMIVTQAVLRGDEVLTHDVQRRQVPQPRRYRPRRLERVGVFFGRRGQESEHCLCAIDSVRFRRERSPWPVRPSAAGADPRCRRRLLCERVLSCTCSP